MKKSTYHNIYHSYDDYTTIYSGCKVNLLVKYVQSVNDDK